MPVHRRTLDSLYRRYNRREHVHPDPLEFLYGWDDVRDREVVGLIASSLAFGRVASILASVREALRRLPCRPAGLAEVGPRALARAYRGFVHRFARGSDMAGLLEGAGRAIREHGSIEACFVAGWSPGDATVLPAVRAFSSYLHGLTGCGCGFLVPRPAGGSACKRLCLYLRWMVRSDDVDPGGWDRISPSALVVPLDTHMLRIGRSLGFTARRAADERAALEVTGGFKRLSPRDPVRWDFCLTRPGIWGQGSLAALPGPEPRKPGA